MSALISSTTTRQSSPGSFAAWRERRSISAAQARCTSSSDSSRLTNNSAATRARSSGSSSSACCKTWFVASVMRRFYSRRQRCRSVTASDQAQAILAPCAPSPYASLATDRCLYRGRCGGDRDFLVAVVSIAEVHMQFHRIAQPRPGPMVLTPSRRDHFCVGKTLWRA